MTARMAFPMLYERLMRGRTEREQMKADIVLGMPGARERYQAALDESYEDLHRMAGGG